MKNSITKNPGRWNAVILAVAFAIVFGYVFDKKLSLGGDNCYYYMYATSLSQGDGYADLSTLDERPTSNFPPGYPLLMAPLRAFTDGIVPQKVLNGLFLLGAAMLVMAFVRRAHPAAGMGLAAGIVAVMNPRVLEFTSMMMSEASFVLFSALTIWFLYRYDTAEKERPWWRNWNFWLMALCAGYGFMIRTQGITLIAAIGVWLLSTRRWLPALAYAAGVAVTMLPWTIRNHIAGIGSSRYFDQIFAVNQWRPEEGYVSVGDLFTRGFKTLEMLVTKALPDSVLPHANIVYDAPATLTGWIGGLLIIGLVALGFWQLRRYFWLLLSYAVFTVGIICLWSAPSQDRYLITLMPLLDVGMLMGVYALVSMAAAKYFSVKMAFSPLWLLVPVLLFTGPRLAKLSKAASEDVPPPYRNFFSLAQYAKRNLPHDAMVCNRKPSLFWVYSQGKCCNYLYTENTEELIGKLVADKVDYVVLEQLGYSSTGRYLYPAIVAHQELFEVVKQLGNPDTYLLKFDRAAAAAKF